MCASPRQDGVPAPGPPAPPPASARQDGVQATDLTPDAGADLHQVAQAAASSFGLLPAHQEDEPDRRSIPERLKTDPETVERDLIKLVLTIVELLRQLMERTALHRVDQGGLTEHQEERVGMTLMILEERMSELCDRYGLTMKDLNLDLGPLGSLLPPGSD